MPVPARRYDDATKTMQDATAEFAGTPEEVTVLVVNADLAIQKGEVDQALSMLKARPRTPVSVGGRLLEFVGSVSGALVWLGSVRGVS